MGTVRGILIVAGGILLAIVSVVVFRWTTTPDETDCALQRADFALGNRDSVDPACR
jgi:hypothetical protein